MKPRVLCCALSSDQGPHLSLLPENGFECDVVDADLDLWNGSALAECLQGYDAVIAGSEPYSADVVDRCPDLRVIARAGVGFDAVDLACCDRRGIAVTTTPGVNHHAVAEQAIALLVGLARDVVVRDRQVRDGVWERKSTPRIQGRTLGVVGLGRIGQATAQRGVGLGMRVIAADPLSDEQTAAQLGAELVSLSQLLREADYVSLHAPVTDSTFHMINAASIATMKPGARLINTARGQLVNEEALVEALTSGQLAGAGLDVFDEEPLSPDSPLTQLENVILSGHISGLDDESHRDTYLMITETLVELYNGGWPSDRIQNLAGVTDWTWGAASTGGTAT